MYFHKDIFYWGVHFLGRPGAPCLLEVIDVTEDSVTLSWLSPEKDGGARILRYIVELMDYSRAEGWIKVRTRVYTRTSSGINIVVHVHVHCGDVMCLCVTGEGD